TIYDPFGRPLKVIEPGDDAINPTRRFFYTPYSSNGGNLICEKVQMDVKSGVGDGYLTTFTFIDGMSRKIQTRVEAEDDPDTGNPRQIVIDQLEYDSRAQVIKQFVPYFEAYSTTCQPLPSQYEDDYTAFQYDAVGRKTKT
ncbi:MAG: hypothetical protein CUN57_02275, partial [Phototrophicales bacterium]